MKKLLLLLLPLLLTACTADPYVAELESRVQELESLNQSYKDRIVQLDKELKSAGVTPPAPETTNPEEETEDYRNDTVDPSPHALQSTHSGTGDSVLQTIKVTSPSLFRFSTQDDSHHDVKAYYGDGEYEYDLLVNSSDPYIGSTYLLPNRTYDILIHCAEAWTAEIYTIGYTNKTSFFGQGDHVTEIFQPETKYYDITYTGDDHFSIKQRFGTGEYDYELLVNETDPYSGTVRLAYPDDLCFFEITGEEGSWTITPAE